MKFEKIEVTLHDIKDWFDENGITSKCHFRSEFDNEGNLLITRWDGNADDDLLMCYINENFEIIYDGFVEHMDDDESEFTDSGFSTIDEIISFILMHIKSIHGELIDYSKKIVEEVNEISKEKDLNVLTFSTCDGNDY